MKMEKNSLTCTECKNSSQKGSVFFYILLGIVLFSALAFTVSRGFRGQSINMVSARQVDLAISEMLDYSQVVENAVSRLRRSGCSENDISFYSDLFVNPSHYNNATSPVDKSCDIFDGNGAAISWQAPPQIIQDIGSVEYLISGALQISGVGSDSSGSIDQEMSLITIVSQEICLAINNKLGIVNPSGNVPGTGQSINANYTVPSTNWQAIGWGFINNQTIGIAGKAIELYGQSAGCYKGSDDNYYFYNILIAR